MAVLCLKEMTNVVYVLVIIINIYRVRHIFSSSSLSLSLCLLHSLGIKILLLFLISPSVVKIPRVKSSKKLKSEAGSSG